MKTQKLNKFQESNKCHQSQIKVLVRIKPNRDDIDNCIDQIEGSNLTLRNVVFEADKIFHESNCFTIYKQYGEPIIDNLLKGFNSTVFTYGQTGSGKSYTMYGSDVNNDENEMGFIYYSVKQIFDEISKTNSPESFKLSMNLFEIYNEQIRDLLKNPNASALSIENSPKEKNYIYQDPIKGVQISDLKTVTIKNLQNFLERLGRGNKRRSVGNNNLNQKSSRSHAIAIIQLEKLNSEDQSTVYSKLNLVDLAGSERQARTETNGMRFFEATKINQSLSALGQVINILATNGQNKQTSKNNFSHYHVPYRTSKLTRILSDSLGGNAKTLMIACISSKKIDCDETISTLRFAIKTRNIKNLLYNNAADEKISLIKNYKNEIYELKKEIQCLRSSRQMSIESIDLKNQNPDDKSSEPKFDPPSDIDGEFNKNAHKDSLKNEKCKNYQLKILIESIERESKSEMQECKLIIEDLDESIYIPNERNWIIPNYKIDDQLVNIIDQDTIIKESVKNNRISIIKNLSGFDPQTSPDISFL